MAKGSNIDPYTQRGIEERDRLVTVKEDGPDQTLVVAGLLGLGSVLFGIHAAVDGDESWLKTGAAAALGMGAYAAFQAQDRERKRLQLMEQEYNRRVIDQMALERAQATRTSGIRTLRRR